DWILTFQAESTDASSHSTGRWEQTRSLPWLLIAITKAKAEQPNLEPLLSAAARIDHNSPAFPSLAFHAVRLLIESNRKDEARTALDKILANDRSRLPASAVNLLLTQRMTLAQNLEDFLQSAQRLPAGFSDNNDGRELPEDEKEIDAATKGSQLFFAID